ncbi:YdcF family protein [Terasakiella sp. A23]|uniref:YdcF family protein n=1 Tax=Terasakiella sp. FCG-A23 TaxID=3080561 RepID=UPI002953B860|nr:YdcF family protein [Terasakiella sp. A23]MDV7340664.1 YdcF family protein [Terasakiella sp. A23]
MVNSVVVVLGAAVDDDGSASPCMKRRCQSGVKIAQDLGGADMLFCGGVTKPGQQQSEAAVMAGLANDYGFEKEKIYLEKTSRNTLENAAFASKLIQQQGWTQIVVVSDRSHLLRARLSFWSCGITASYRAARHGPKAGVREIFSWLREVPALLWYGVRVLNGHPNLLMTQVK